MDITPSSADWSLIQAYLAVAQTGSLSGAARQLGRSQPTLGRQIKALERALGADLFDRHARGLHLSETGQALLPHAERMQQAMGAITLISAGQEQRLAGTVRITASVFISHLVLPPILAEIRALEPEIQIDLIPSDATENLLFRAADIALRMYRPDQLDLIASHISDIALGTFAATTYLARAGYPQTPEDLMSHDMIGYDSDDQILRAMRSMGWPVDRSAFGVRCDDQAAYWQLVRAGCGIGFSQLSVGRADPLVQQVLPELAIPPLPLWLAAHEAMRHTPRIRRVWDLLAEALRNRTRTLAH